MTRFLLVVLLTAVTALGTEVTTPSTSTDQSGATFNKDVLPVLQQNCQTCHRPGGVAPMSFLNYESTRPWAKAIKTALLSQKMPPWFADPHYGEFRNAPKMTQTDVAKLVAWADNGAREGDAADRPAARQWADGWRIRPDVVVSMPEPYRVGAQGAGEVREFFIPNPFKEDTWVSAMEIRPGDPSVVHHVIVQVPEQGALTEGALFRDAFQDGFQAALQAKGVGAEQKAAPERTADAFKLEAELAERGLLSKDVVAFVSGTASGNSVRRQGGGSYSDILARLREQQTGKGSFTTMEAVYAPGGSPLDFQYTDSAKLIKGGKPIRLEVHYTPNGKETLDQTQVAFTLAKGPAQRRFVMMAPEHLVDSRKPIPAGDGNWETKGELTFDKDADLVWFMPHMHLRGKDMTFRLIYPDGREETVLSAKFNFNWQIGYEVEKPIHMPKGTKMVVTAHHDNSPNNPMNPMPSQAVPWGEMTSQEMMLPWFGVLVDRDAQPETIATYRPGDFDAGTVGRTEGIRFVDIEAVQSRPAK
jgi:hypothetical protein